MAFLNLLLELRFQVYSLIVASDTAPFSDYRGLYLSCKKVKAELDQEGPKIVQKIVADLNVLRSGIQVHAPTLFPALDLHVTLDPSTFPDYRQPINFPDLLPFVSHAYIMSLRISLNEPAGDLSDPVPTIFRCQWKLPHVGMSQHVGMDIFYVFTNIPSHNSTLSFLALPPELRFQVYAIIANPDTPFSSYRGLYLSCQEVKSEIDHEASKLLATYFTMLTNCAPAGIAISFSTNAPFPAPQHIHLTIDIVMYPRRFYPEKKFLEHIFALHLASPTIKFDTVPIPDSYRNKDRRND
ncbi:hypothetical protein CC86DRAFT_382020 [Ophiobolus disseminans]|uniref:Uncharacterized protein n=1 Tax=Ophiobolus disseminans TaxID=1469910 RepID=A0A6A7A341_9PLEO|nr:hypothetical protein CC86DRAFT_382020 [Ophiobolus disseminans]